MNRFPSPPFRPLSLVLAFTFSGSALAATPGLLAYLKGGQVWVQPGGPATARPLPGSQGALLLDVSPDMGTLAYLTGPTGTRLDAAQVPPLKLALSRPPYTRSQPLNSLLPGAGGTVPARWLAWQGPLLLAGTDRGPVGWDLQARQVLSPEQVPALASVSRDGEVTVTSGTVASPTEPGVLLYGPGARPGTEVFSLSQPQGLRSALTRAGAALAPFLGQLDSRAQRDAANWATTPPEVSADGRAVYFASNVGTGLGNAGDTRSVVFRVQVEDVTLQALGWLGVLSGQVLAVTPSPDGRRLLILSERHLSGGQPASRLQVADLGTRQVREVSTAPTGTRVVIDSVCWRADSHTLAYSVRVAGQPGATLVVSDVVSGQVQQRVPGATAVACGPA